MPPLTSTGPSRRATPLARLLLGTAVILTTVVASALPASAAGTVTISPNTALVSHQIVNISGSGFTPNTLIGYCQGAIPVGTPDLTWCSQQHLGGGTTNSSGAFAPSGRSIQLQRFLYIPALADWVDCADPSEPCGVAIAEAGDVAGTAAWTKLHYAPPPPPPAVRGTLTASPSGPVRTKSLVTLNGAGFRPNTWVELQWCRPGSALPTLDDCQDGFTFAYAGSTGSFSKESSAPGTLTLFDGTVVDCVAVGTANPCRYAASEVIDFPGTVTAAPAPAVYIVPTITPPVITTPEGAVGKTVTLAVWLSHSVDKPITVDWTTLHAPGAPDFQATAGVDYTAASGTVTFEPNVAMKTITIDVLGDTVIEPDEYIVVSFTNPTNANMGGFWGLGFVTLTNDD